ncbi:hypothetical protein C8Q76DRAFT_738797 [Earliella scabrosa]|nr:hypothetical protein C8Q76DRAFT_738797 [Earliella scabrosa]
MRLEFMDRFTPDRLAQPLTGATRSVEAHALPSVHPLHDDHILLSILPSAPARPRQD